MISQPDVNEDGNPMLSGGENVLRPGAAHDVPSRAVWTAVRDTTRLTRLLTILSESAPLEMMLDRVLSTLSELFTADIVVLVDPVGSGVFSPLAAIGLPEDMIHLPMSDAETGYVAISMTTKIPIVKTGVSKDSTVESQFRELGTETAVWIPVIGSHAPRGTLILARCNTTPFAPADVDLLVAMAYRIGLALDQEEQILADLRHNHVLLLEQKKKLEFLNERLLQTNQAFSTLAQNLDFERTEILNRIHHKIESDVIPSLTQIQSDTHMTRYSIEISMILNALQGIIFDACPNDLLSGCLTAAEVRVASLIKKGLTTDLIAKQLLISEETVKTHRKKIRKKLNITNSQNTLRDYLLNKPMNAIQ